VLIYNPIAGRRRSLREKQVREAAETLILRGHHVEIVPTTSAGSATCQAKAASMSADVVFACGGDGTIHEVMQGLVSETGQPICALGVIPLGSANALARHLRISLDPCAAVLQQLHGRSHTVPVGKLTYADITRYFAVMAGAGPDGAFARGLLTSHKSRMGRFAYYLHAAQLFVLRRFSAFEIETKETPSSISKIHRAVAVMATRVASLGGFFRGLTSGEASIDDEVMRLVILKPPALVSLPLWFLTGWVGACRLNPFFCTANAISFVCRPLQPVSTYFQADGEWLGSLPFEAQIIPNALRILEPEYMASDKAI